VKPAGDELLPGGGETAAAGHPPHEQLITIRRAERTDAVIVQVDGAVDGLTAPRLRAGLATAFARLDGRVLVVDLTEVTFFGSAGLRALADAADEAAARPGFEVLRVVVDHNRPVLRPIELTGYDAVLALFYDLEEAIAGTPRE
jgi:anti-sigma B factor antagonist